MRNLTSGNEAKLLFYFALPMLVGNVFQQLYSTVDSIIVGRALGKNALAADIDKGIRVDAGENEGE